MGSHLVMIDNYIYLYHTKTFVVIPTYPEQIADTMQASFAQTTVLSRSAPIFAYSNSGPRSFQITLNLHRDLMKDVNFKVSNMKIPVGEDYVDVLIKQMQAAVLPRYSASEKMVDPPIIALRFGNDIFCKGVINGSLTTTYSGPILKTNNYAEVSISFNISEIDPYDADTVVTSGSFRGLSMSLERGLWKISG